MVLKPLRLLVTHDRVRLSGTGGSLLAYCVPNGSAHRLAHARFASLTAVSLTQDP